MSQRRIIHAGPNAFRMIGARATFLHRCTAAVLDVGEDCVISHTTAARLLGLEGFSRRSDKDIVEVTIGFARRIDRDHVEIHRTRRIEPSEIVTADGIVCTSIARTLLDLAVSADPAVLSAALDGALRDHPACELQLRRLLASSFARRRNGAHRLRGLLDGSKHARPHSVLERRFLDIVREAELPTPKTQVVFAEGAEFVARVDFVFPGGLVVEVSGHRTHSTRLQRRADAERHRRLAKIGVPWVEFTSDEVFGDPVAVVAELRTFDGLTATSNNGHTTESTTPPRQ